MCVCVCVLFGVFVWVCLNSRREKHNFISGGLISADPQHHFIRGRFVNRRSPLQRACLEVNRAHPLVKLPYQGFIFHRSCSQVNSFEPPPAHRFCSKCFRPQASRSQNAFSSPRGQPLIYPVGLYECSSVEPQKRFFLGITHFPTWTPPVIVNLADLCKTHMFKVSNMYFSC